MSDILEELLEAEQGGSEFAGRCARAFAALIDDNKAAWATNRAIDNARMTDRKAYEELIYAVERKFPNETRHETALRYIRQTEERANSGSPTDAAEEVKT